MSEKMIELFLTDVKYHLSSEKPAKFTFEGMIDHKNEKKILEEIKVNPIDCKLKFYIKLPEE